MMQDEDEIMTQFDCNNILYSRGWQAFKDGVPFNESNKERWKTGWTEAQEKNERFPFKGRTYDFDEQEDEPGSGDEGKKCKKTVPSDKKILQGDKGVCAKPKKKKAKKGSLSIGEASKIND